MFRQVKVAVRVYTLLEKDEENNNANEWKITESSDFLSESGSEDNVDIDKVAENGFYKTVAEPFIEAMTCGLSGSILIIEDRLVGEKSVMIGDTAAHGIIQLSVGNIFKKIGELNRKKFILSASFVEICSESVNDLLEGNDTDLEPCWEMEQLSELKTLRKQEVQTAENVWDLISKGTRKRSYDTSSYTIFNVNLEKKGEDPVSRLKFLYLSGCINLCGASGDQLETCYHNLTHDHIFSLLSRKQDEYVRFQETLLYRVLNNFLEGSSVICSVSTGASVNFFSSTGFSYRITYDENKLKQSATLADASIHNDNKGPQNETDSTSSKKNLPIMYSQPTLSQKSNLRPISVLNTIEEEEEVEEKDGTETVLKPIEESQDGLQDDGVECQKEFPYNLTKEENCVQSSSYERINEILQHEEIISELQNEVAYYQTNLKELQEFTRAEKQIYEEHFNTQLMGANLRIEELESKTKKLEDLLKVMKDKPTKTTENCVVCVNSKEKDALEKELAFLKQQLITSETKRNDCEGRLEWIEIKSRKRIRELTELLEEAWSESSVAEEDPDDLSSGYNSEVVAHAEQYKIEAEALKKEISVLKTKSVKNAEISERIQEFKNLKRSLIEEKKLTAKIPDLENKIDILKTENTNLSENLNVITFKLKEINATHLLFREENCLLKDQNEKLTKNLEEKFVEIKDLSSENVKLKVEIETVQNNNINCTKSIKENMLKINSLCSENSNLKKDIDKLNENVVNLLKKLDCTKVEIQGLLSKNVNLMEEINIVKNENVSLIDTLERKRQEMNSLRNENSIMLDKLYSLKDNEQFLSNMKEKIDNLASKLIASETQIAQFDTLDKENLKLRDDISSLKNENAIILSLSNEKNKKMSELSAENVSLKKETCTLATYNANLSDCLENNNIKIQELDSENCRLKDELCLLQQNALNVDQTSRRKDSEIQKLLNDNFILREKIFSLRAKNEKVNILASENNILKENMDILASELEEKTIETSQLSTELEQERLETVQVKSELSLLKEKIMHHEERIMNPRIHSNIDIQSRVYPNVNSDRFLEGNVSNKEMLNYANKIDKNNQVGFFGELFKPHETRSAPGNMNSRTNSSLLMDLAMQTEQRANWLQRKLSRKRRMLNITQRREMQMRSNVEMYENQLENLRSLQQANALQNYRILQMQLHAQHEDYVHRHRANCLESFVAELKKENTFLRTQLRRVHSKMKILSTNSKMSTQNGHSQYKQVAVQTTFTEMADTFPHSFEVPERDTEGTVVNNNHGLPNVDVKIPSIQFKDNIFPDTLDRQFSNLHKLQYTSTIPSGLIENKRNKELCMRKKFGSRHAGKNMRKIQKEMSPCNYNIGNADTQNFSHTRHDGAEGWARLGREFDEQNDMQTSTSANY